MVKGGDGVTELVEISSHLLAAKNAIRLSMSELWHLRRETLKLTKGTSVTSPLLTEGDDESSSGISVSPIVVTVFLVTRPNKIWRRTAIVRTLPCTLFPD
jgi:hypothetical protein